MTCIFLSEKNLELVANAFFMNVKANNFKHFAEKVIVCSKGLKGAPLNTLKLFSAKCFIFFQHAFDTN